MINAEKRKRKIEKIGKIGKRAKSLEKFGKEKYAEAGFEPATDKNRTF